MRRLSTIAALITVAVAAPRSTAQTIDFENIPGTGYQQLASYTQNGFTLTPGAGSTSLFGSHGPFMPDGTTPNPNYPGSRALFHQDPNATITLSQVGGGPFRLTSIDVTELNPGTGQSVPLNFTGELAGGGTVTQAFTLDGTFGFQTLTFPTTFTDLSLVRWTQESQFHQFDNIVLVPVPEPSTVLGFAALCGGALGLIRRYRRRQSSSPAGSSSESAADFMTSRSSTVA
jgi:hypothetical protein